MAKPVRSLLDAARRGWSVVVGTKRSADRVQGVLLHDPEAGRPKDLDNPFHDARSQERVGDFIARATRGGERKPPE